MRYMVWIKNEGNAHLEGFRYSVVEFLDDVPVALKAWEDHKDIVIIFQLIK